jgi:hypothetical protein
MDPENINIPNIFKINFNIVLNLRQDLPNSFFPSGSPTAICYAFLVSPISATCFAPFFLFDFFVLKCVAESILYDASLQISSSLVADTEVAVENAGLETGCNERRTQLSESGPKVEQNSSMLYTMKNGGCYFPCNNDLILATCNIQPKGLGTRNHFRLRKEVRCDEDIRV